MVIEETEGMYEYRIRKLTAKECCRLMDFGDEAADAILSTNSQTQAYKQAGNSIVVNCLVAIFGQLFEGKEDVYKEPKTEWKDDFSKHMNPPVEEEE